MKYLLNDQWMLNVYSHSETGAIKCYHQDGFHNYFTNKKILVILFKTRLQTLAKPNLIVRSKVLGAHSLPRGSKSTELRLESSLWSCIGGLGPAAREVTSGLDASEPPADRTETALADDDATDVFDRPLCKYISCNLEKTSLWITSSHYFCV